MKRKIGSVGVDAGMVYIGDPCYIARTPLGHTSDDPKDEHWRAFLRQIGELDSGYATVTGSYAPGREFPAGVCVAGFGDGEYPVYADFAKDGTIVRVTIEFVRR